jgi:hypothetical protein
MPAKDTILAVLVENGATAPETDTDTLATRIADALSNAPDAPEELDHTDTPTPEPLA